MPYFELFVLVSLGYFRQESRKHATDQTDGDGGLLQRTLDGFYKSQAYGKDKSMLRIASSLITFIVDGVFVLAGGYAFTWDLARDTARDWQLVWSGCHSETLVAK